MDLARLFLLTGLCLNFIGFIILFYFGRKPMPISDYGTYLYKTEELKDKNQELHEKRKKFSRRNAIGLIINVIGFAFQIVVVFL